MGDTISTKTVLQSALALILAWTIMELLGLVVGGILGPILGPLAPFIGMGLAALFILWLIDRM